MSIKLNLNPQHLMGYRIYLMKSTGARGTYEPANAIDVRVNR